MTNNDNETIFIDCYICKKQYEISKKLIKRFGLGLNYWCYCVSCIIKKGELE